MTSDPFDHIPVNQAESDPFGHIPSGPQAELRAKPYQSSDDGPDADLPVFLRRDNAFNRLSNSVERGATFGLSGEVVPVSRFVGKLAATGSLGQAQDSYHAAKQQELQKAQRSRDEFGIAPEIIGGFGGLGSAVTAAKAMPWYESAGKGIATGAGLGAVSGASSGDGTLGERLTDTAAGAGLGVAGYGLGAGLGYGIGKAAPVLGRAIADARDPEAAAYRKIAERLDQSGVDAQDVRNIVAPASKRATSADQVSEIVKRSNDGQSQEQIAREMGLSKGVVSDRLAGFAENTRVPLNTIDAVKLVTREQGRQGGDQPVTRLARAAAAYQSEGDKIAAERLVQRQVEQPSRVADHIEALTVGPSLEEHTENLRNILEDKSRVAFATSSKNEQPFDLTPAIKQFRDVEFNAAGDIKTGLSKAIDLFFKPGYAAEGAGSTRYTGFYEPVDTLERFQGARQALDQQIQSSMKDGRATPLTRRLTQLRQAVTKPVEDANPDFAAANSQFSGAKDSQAIIKLGEKAVLRGGGQQRYTLSQFDSMTPEQQELFRASFKQKLLDAVASKTDGGPSPVRQFTSDTAKSFINRVFEKKEATRLLRALTSENITTETLRDVFSGSRTAPLLNDLEALKSGAGIAGDLATANVPGLIKRVGGRVAEGITSQQSKHMLDILTNTDASKILPAFDNIASAQTKNALNAKRAAVVRNYLSQSMGTAGVNALAQREDDRLAR